MNQEEIARIKACMVQYTGTKTINAVPMTRGEYNALRGWKIPADENPNDFGYLVEYHNDSKTNVEGFSGYISWSPRGPFHQAYKKSGTFSDRLVIEMDDLNVKIHKLEAYLRGANRDTNQFTLMCIQLDAMKAYYKTLMARWELLSDQTMCAHQGQQGARTIGTPRISPSSLSQDEEIGVCLTTQRTMTQKTTPTLTWEENEKGTLIGTATLDDGTVVKYKCINMGDDDNPKWVHLRAMCSTNDRRYKGDYDLSVETEIEGREDAQTRMRSIHLCMKDLRELVKTL